MRMMGMPQGPQRGLLGKSTDLVCALAAAALAVALVATGLLHRTDFFLNDDFRTYLIPMMGEISRLVRDGEIPFITNRLWHGGALLAEYQIAILNPVCLILITILGAMENFAAVAAIYALVHIAIFAAGTFVLCRTLGCGRKQAILAAVVAPSSEWIVYWGAADWIPFLISIAWMPWAGAALTKATRNIRWCIPGAAAVYLVIASGSVFADLALLIWVASAAVAADWRSGLSRRQIVGPAIAIVSGGLLSLPAVFPLTAYLAGSGRALESPHWQADLVALFGVGVPFMLTRWYGFSERFEVVCLPMIGIAWYMLPALFNARWRLLWEKPAVRILTFAIVALGLLAMLPGFWQFRWMFRLLPFYQFGLVILSALALSQGRGDLEPWKAWIIAASVGLPIWISIWQVPSFGAIFFLIGCLIFVFSFLSWRQRRDGQEGFTAIALTGHVLLFFVVGTIYADMPNRFPNNWKPPTIHEPGTEPALTRYEIFDLPQSHPSDRYWLDYRPGNTNLERPGKSINGYTAFWLTAYEKSFCLAHLGTTWCPDIVRRIESPVMPTTLSLLELMRVDEVRIAGAARAQLFGKTNSNWVRAGGTNENQIFHRTHPYSLPAPVSWVTPGTTVTVSGETSSRVTFEVNNPGTAPTTVILARAWYPGWSAGMAGHRLSVHPIDGLLTAIDIPPGARGKIDLVYWPEGLGLGLFGALLGLVILALACFADRQRQTSHAIQSATLAGSANFEWK